MNRKKYLGWLRNLLVFLVLVYAVEYWQSRHLMRGVLPDDLRLESLPTIPGNTRSLWSPERYTVVYVFAPWCGVCRASADNIDRLPDRFHKVSLALSWEKPEEVTAFIEKTGLKTEVLLGRDKEEAVLGIEAFPSYLVIDKEGRVVKAWSGYTSTFGLVLKSYLAQL